MASTLVRGKYVICKALDRTSVEMIEDGAVFQQDGRIVEVGPYDQLAQKYTPDQVVGSPHHAGLR
jgi:cytosine/adenosine deaminase-related metal-dependent hydrolase